MQIKNNYNFVSFKELAPLSNEQVIRPALESCFDQLDDELLFNLRSEKTKTEIIKQGFKNSELESAKNIIKEAIEKLKTLL